MSDLSQRVRSVGVINVAAVIVSFAAGILAAVAAPQLGLPNDPWIVVGVVLAALIVLAIAIAFLRGTEGGRASVYAGVLLVTSVLLPGVAVAIAVPLYLFLSPDPLARFAGLVAATAGLLLWIVGPFLLFVWARPKSAYGSVYSELEERLFALQRQLKTAEHGGDDIQKQHCLELQGRVKAVLEELQKNKSGGKWLTGEGYVDVYRALHNLEAEALLVESPSVLIARAREDELRLAPPAGSERSPIGNAPELITRLKAAADALGGQDAEAKKVARVTISTIHREISQFRDDARSGLLVAKFRALRATTFTGVTSYIVVFLALLLNIDRELLLAATGFYMVGAIVGLFRWLLDDSTRTGGVEDYGFTTARLIQAPLLSGIAAIAGVFLIAMLSAPGVSDALRPPPAAAAPTSSPAAIATPSADDTNDATETPPPGLGVALAQQQVEPSPAPSATPGVESPARGNEYPTYNQIFSLDYRFGLLIAAIFGLTPSLLVNRLSALAEHYTQQLRSTQATSGSTPS